MFEILLSTRRVGGFFQLEKIKQFGYGILIQGVNFVFLIKRRTFGVWSSARMAGRLFLGGEAGSDGGSIYQWDLFGDGSSTPSRIYPHMEKAWDIEISADGTILAAVLGSSVVLREIESGQEIGEPLVHSYSVYDILFVDDDRRMVTACEDGRFRVWDLASRAIIYLSQQQDFAVRGVDESPDGRFIATAGWDSVLRFWGRPDGNMVTTVLRHSGRVNSVRFGSGGHKVATTCSDGTLRVWDLAGQQAPVRTDGRWVAHHNGYLTRLSGDTIELKKFGETIDLPKLEIDSAKGTKVVLTERGDFLVVQEARIGSEYSISLLDLEQPDGIFRQLKFRFDDEILFADVSRGRAYLSLAGRRKAQVFSLETELSEWPPIETEHEIRRMYLSHSEEQLVIQTIEEVSVADIEGFSVVQGPIRTGNDLKYSVVSSDDSMLAVCESDDGLDQRSAFLYRFGGSREPYAELR